MADLSQEVRDVMKKNRWLALSTVSREGVPQNSLVVYVSDGNIIYVHTSGDALKVRNIKETGRVGVVIPFYKNFLHRMIKQAPPAEIHFRGEAEILPYDAEEPKEWFKRIIGAKLTEEVEKNSVWLKIRPASKIACYGVGVSFMKMRNPEESMAVIELK